MVTKATISASEVTSVNEISAVVLEHLCISSVISFQVTPYTFQYLNYDNK